MQHSYTELFSTPTGKYSVSRLPKSSPGNLRAWDAADELIINILFSDYLKNLKHAEHAAMLIVNDAFGALTLALSEFTVDNWSDSYVSHLAAQENLNANNFAQDKNHIRFIPATDALENQYSLVLIKIPKTLSLLEDQLFHLKPHISKDTTIIAGAMTKHVHTSTLALFEDIIGTTTTSLAKKKARLIFAKNNREVNQTSPYPRIIKDEETRLTLFNHANVFSQDKLDIGTRFFINNMHLCPQANHIIDLACGNGALGIIAQRLQANAKLSFIDESYNALASARLSYAHAFGDNNSNNKPVFFISHALSQFSSANYDKAFSGTQLILCNPPFHQAHSIGDQIAWDMFKQSHGLLNTNDELWVIGNRHLAYHIKLEKIFGNCKTITSNKNFVILAANKTKY